MGEEENPVHCAACGRHWTRCACQGGPFKRVVRFGQARLVRFDEKTESKEVLSRGEFAAGLLIVAADAVERANKKIAEQASPVFVLEDVLEGMAALIEESKAQQEDLAEFVVDEAGRRPIDDPERLREVIQRTLRRRRLRT